MIGFARNPRSTSAGFPILRDIDRVACDALRTVARRKLKEVDRSLVSAFLADEN